MSFFATSVGSGQSGGNLGGLAGADTRCQNLAAAVGLGAKTWRAYLGTSGLVASSTFVNPKDRIGRGPWFNHDGVQIAASVDDLHTRQLDGTLLLTETGVAVPLDEHDILTGAERNGEVRGNDTCEDWTSGATGGPTGFVGHADPSVAPPNSWNSAHRTTGCSQADFAQTKSAGRLYCFAVDPPGDAGVAADAARMDAAPGTDGNTGTDAEPALDAQTGADAGSGTPSPMMSFFVTSVGNAPNGGNLGGLGGADAKCQNLASAVGLGAKTWRAYLGTAGLTPASTLVHPRDRIGAGPWFNYNGVVFATSVADLHTRVLDGSLILTEMGAAVPLMEHDVLTGAQPSGDVFGEDTCVDWTSSALAPPAGAPTGFVGHADPSVAPPNSWNSAHRSVGCSQGELAQSAGAGRLYCFAID